MPTEMTFVTYAWDDAAAAKLDPVGRLVYRSNLLGSDQRVTNTGGGNTSAKVAEADPLTGQSVDVLWVKGSGGDLRTSKRENFASLYLDKVLALEARYAAAATKGAKTPVEDDMVGMYPHATFNLNPRASSIDTPLHAFLPARHVDHTHPNAAIAVAAAKHSERLTKEIYDDDVAYVGWQRPGFDLGLVMRDAAAKHPKARGLIMGQHGLINWADDDKDCYDLTLSLIERAARHIDSHDKGEKTFGGAKHQSLPAVQRDATLAAVLPWLRGQVSRQKRLIGTVQTDANILRFVNSLDAPRLAELGTSCPDHFLRTKIKPLYVPWDPATGDVASLQAMLETGLAKYKADYTEYYNSCKRPDSPAMRDPNPTVVLIPGLGMIAAGKTKSESRVTAEFYTCAIEVMRGAEAINKYVALPRQEAFDIEYWALEEAKLQRMPAERELARRVVAVVGAGSGIGKSVATRLAIEGAHLVCVDMSEPAAAATAEELTAKYGKGIGVAGTGVSGCGPATAVAADITKRESIRRVRARHPRLRRARSPGRHGRHLRPARRRRGTSPTSRWASHVSTST